MDRRFGHFFAVEDSKNAQPRPQDVVIVRYNLVQTKLKNIAPNLTTIRESISFWSKETSLGMYREKWSPCFFPYVRHVYLSLGINNCIEFLSGSPFVNHGVHLISLLLTSMCTALSVL